MVASSHADALVRAQRPMAGVEAQDFVRRLASFRRNSPAMTEGDLIHFAPADGVYAGLLRVLDGPDAGLPGYVVNVWGVGYRFEP